MKFNASLFMLVVAIVAYFIVDEPIKKEQDYSASIAERSHVSNKMIETKPIVDKPKEQEYLHAGSDEIYPDMGYDEDGWSKRGYMSTSEFHGSHLNGNQEKLAKLRTRISKERQSFIDDISKNAKDLANKFNVPASIIAAQAILESGYGTSRLANVANNLFGHMGGKTETSRGISGSVKAYDKNINGKTISYHFRKYESRWWSMWNHVQLLNKTYAPRLINIPNKREAWLAAICGCSDSRMLASDSKKLADKGGYLYASACAWPASDGITSRYVAELRHIINSYNLANLD
jgi:flagellum-specific peptidoglycan hydrolase FlgJ